MKATSVATSNIAFVKYWGRINDDLRLPMNGSVSMNISGATTTTTVVFDESLENDEVKLQGKMLNEEQVGRVSKHLDRIRQLSGFTIAAKVVSHNNFPMGAGIASSASAFAALTVAGTAAAGLDLPERELTILARQGSGSACRSVPAGFVQWHYGETSAESFAEQIAPPGHWDMHDVIAIVQTEHKEVGSAQGNALVSTSPFNEIRVEQAHESVNIIRKAIQERDFTTFGEETEREAIRLHVIAMTSQPPIFYWSPTTLSIIKAVMQWRSEGLESYYTIDAGANVHIMTQAKDVDEVATRLAAVDGVQNTLTNRPGHGTHLVDKHLF